MTVRLDAVLAALEAVLGPPTGPLVPIGGGMTNENVRVEFACGPAVVRLAGAGTELLGIDRADEAQATRNAADLGIGPALLAELPEHGTIATRFVDARPLTEEEVRGARRDEVVAALRTLHDGPPVPGRFDVRAVLAAYAQTAREHGVPEHRHEALARKLTDRATAVMTGPEHTPVACHNDLLAANLLHDGERLWIVDWEYAGMNDRYFDLANLAVNNGFGPLDEEALLTAYFGAAGARRLARLRLMRLVSDAREAMWGVVQQGASALDVDFAAYADRHFARLADAAGGERLDALLRAAG